MKPAPFDYVAPTLVDEALAQLAQHGDDARLLAGGQSLVPLMNMRLMQPAVLIDLGRCAGLDRIEDADDAIVCHAMVRQIAAEESPLVRAHCPLLAAALPYLGGPANRNRGTVCGSLAHADRLAELPAVAMALDASFEIAGNGGQRRIAAAEFFQGDLATAVETGEMLRGVRFPKAKGDTRAAFVEVGNRRHGFALLGVAAQVTLDGDGACADARLAVMGVDDRPMRLSEAEAALQGRPLDDAAIAASAEATTASVEPQGDNAASADYRRRVSGVLVMRALRQITGEAA